MAHAARSERDFDRRVPPARIAELDSLGSDFNALLGEMEAWQSHLQSENETLAHQANHDSLTGLPNRAFFEGRLIRALRSAAKVNEQVAVLFLDSDRFKDINDNFGHAAGDAVLVAVADRVRAQLRDDDLVARLGGDEFAILLAPLHKVEDAAAHRRQNHRQHGLADRRARQHPGIDLPQYRHRHLPRSWCHPRHLAQCRRRGDVPGQTGFPGRPANGRVGALCRQSFNTGVDPLFSTARVMFFTLLVALLALGGCQTAPPKGLTPAQVAVLKQQGFELTDEGWAFGLSGKVLFGSDVETLNQPSTDIVQRIGKALLGVGIERVRVDGHTDTSGKETYNQQLSLRRAKSVATVLTGRGYERRKHPTARPGQQPSRWRPTTRRRGAPRIGGCRLW